MVCWACIGGACRIVVLLHSSGVCAETVHLQMGQGEKTCQQCAAACAKGFVHSKGSGKLQTGAGLVNWFGRNA